MISAEKYKYSDFSIGFTAIAACIICYLYTWQNHLPVNFTGGDARYYYIYLQSTFIEPSLINSDWLDPANGIVITHHPVGLSILLLPFFLAAMLFTSLLNYPMDGVSAPFQASISIAAIFYCILGLAYLKKLLVLNEIPDKISALVILLVFFGSTLFHYTLNESGMSHVYSFCLLTVFMYYSCRLVRNFDLRSLLPLAITFGLVLLLRPNDALIIFSIFFWFSSKAHCVSFFKDLLRSRRFYFSILLLLVILAIQPLTWLWKENTLYADRYATYGFYWLHPHLIEMLFGFEAGFFVYTPLCFLFLLGLLPVYMKNKILFYTSSVFILLLFYVFSTYSAYTYYDGLGIRVLVDYYSLFALLGAKLFVALDQYKHVFNSVATIALFLVMINLVYCYQGENNILARSGMNFRKWIYVFMQTGKAYENSLGGSSDLPPYSKVQPAAALNSEVKFDKPYDFVNNEYGPPLAFDSLGFNSKRVQIKLKIARTERSVNSSRDVLVCALLEDSSGLQKKAYLQFRLNETPSVACCETIEYDYSANMEAQFKASDRLKIYLWNIKRQDFSLEKFSARVYNYNY